MNKKTLSLRELSVNELNQKIQEERSSLLNMRLRKQLKQVEKPIEERANRRNIARMLTLVNQKQPTAV